MFHGLFKINQEPMSDTTTHDACTRNLSKWVTFPLCLLSNIVIYLSKNKKCQGCGICIVRLVFTLSCMYIWLHTAKWVFFFCFLFSRLLHKTSFPYITKFQTIRILSMCHRAIKKEIKRTLRISTPWDVVGHPHTNTMIKNLIHLINLFRHPLSSLL